MPLLGIPPVHGLKAPAWITPSGCLRRRPLPAGAFFLLSDPFVLRGATSRAPPESHPSLSTAESNPTSKSPRTASTTKKRSLHAIEWLNFFVADVQTGLGPFLAAYLAASGWSPAHVGVFLTFGGLVPIAFQLPAGGFVDLLRRKRALAAGSIGLIGIGALLLASSASFASVLFSELLLATAGLFIGPILNSITLGIAGKAGFERQIGKNQSFSAGGNVAAALLMAAVSYWIGIRCVFLCSAILTLPTLGCLARVRSTDIDLNEARGAMPRGASRSAGIFSVLLGDRVLLVFFICAALFHLSNAAMLPQLGEMLARGHVRAAGAFMSACVTVTQLVITFTAAPTGLLAARIGRRPLLLTGFGSLVIRGCLYTLVHSNAALIAIQVLDGVANVIFGVVSALVVADRTRGTGRFNLAQGALATSVGIGAALSTTVGGFLIQKFNFAASFLGLAAVGLVAFFLLLFFFPETRNNPTATAGADFIPAQ
jgi:MFS family permease